MSPVKDRREFDKARTDALKARTSKTACHYGEENYVPPPSERVFFEGEKRIVEDAVFIRRNDKWEYSHHMRVVAAGAPLTAAPVEDDAESEYDDGGNPASGS